MYLRFRSSQLQPKKGDDTFEEIYRLIHGKPPEQIRPESNSSITLKIHLVRNQRVDKKPRQIYIGTLANIKIYLDDSNKAIINENLWSDLQARMENLGIGADLQIKFKEQIKGRLEIINITRANQN